MSDNYALDGQIPVLVKDDREWAKWFETAERHVNETYMFGGAWVSTVFLGLDHSFGTGRPVLFETMIFGGRHDEYQERYHTWEEAEAGHKTAIRMEEGTDWQFFLTLMKAAFGPTKTKEAQ